MEKLINGKTKVAIMEELSVPFLDEFKEESNGYIVVNVQRYLDRLDEVIGCLNYSLITKESVFTDVAIYKTVEIVIYYDDGTIAVSKSGDGGDTFVYPKETEKPKQPQNTNDSAMSDAIKRACKKLRIGLDVYHENRRLTGKEKSPTREVTGEIEEFRLYFKSELRQDGSLKNAYYADVETVDGMEATLVIWQEKVGELMRKGLFETLLDLSRKSGRAKLLGKYQVFGKKQFSQIVFEEVAHDR